MFKLELGSSEEDFLIDLLEVSSVRIKNHIAHLNHSLRAIEGDIIDTKRLISSNRLVIFGDPESKLKRQLNEKDEIELSIRFSYRRLADLRSIYTKLVSDNRDYLLDNPKVFREPGANALLWHGYQSYHYDRVG